MLTGVTYLEWQLKIRACGLIYVTDDTHMKLYRAGDTTYRVVFKAEFSRSGLDAVSQQCITDPYVTHPAILKSYNFMCVYENDKTIVSYS